MVQYPNVFTRIQKRDYSFFAGISGIAGISVLSIPITVDVDSEERMALRGEIIKYNVFFL